MFYDEHNPAHFHAQYGEHKAVFDFRGNVIRGDLQSKTATKLVREWIDLHTLELLRNWELARENRPLNEVAPLD